MLLKIVEVLPRCFRGYEWVALVPRTPHFDLPSAFTIIHGIGRSTKN